VFHTAQVAKSFSCCSVTFRSTGPAGGGTGGSNMLRLRSMLIGSLCVLARGTVFLSLTMNRPLVHRFCGFYTGHMDEQETPSGIIEVDLFSKDMDDPDHPEVVRFRRLLEDVAADYGCSLVSFSVNQGTVSFGFDDDVLTADILRELEMDYGKEGRHPPA